MSWYEPSRSSNSKDISWEFGGSARSSTGGSRRNGVSAIRQVFRCSAVSLAG